MEYGKIRVVIKGLTPLLMNRMNPDDLREKKPGLGRKTYVPEEEARKAAYITEVDGEEQLYVPSRWLYSNILRASSSYTAKYGGSSRKKSLRYLLAGTIRIEPDKILLGKTPSEYEIDEKTGIIKGNRIIIWRPRIDDWKIEFFIIYNKRYITDLIRETLREIINDGGIRLGIGDFRPQHMGPYGTFEVTEFQIED